MGAVEMNRTELGNDALVGRLLELLNDTLPKEQRVSLKNSTTTFDDLGVSSMTLLRFFLSVEEEFFVNFESMPFQELTSIELVANAVASVKAWK
jgi:acyl carrier protein